MYPALVTTSLMLAPCYTLLFNVDLQWHAKICDKKGDGCLHGPHALCCQLECNFRYAYGNMVQRAHAKVRYEGTQLRHRFGSGPFARSFKVHTVSHVPCDLLHLVPLLVGCCLVIFIWGPIHVIRHGAGQA